MNLAISPRRFLPAESIMGFIFGVGNSNMKVNRKMSKYLPQITQINADNSVQAWLIGSLRETKRHIISDTKLEVFTSDSG